MRSAISALAGGLLFGAGLGLSGMTQPEKVLAFLDVTGAWDPSLMFVMGGAIAVHLLLARWILRRDRPLLDTRFHLPTRTDLEPQLIVGSALFGIGWGLGGVCPGPGIVWLGSGAAGAIVWVVAMAIGMAIQYATQDRQDIPRKAPSEARSRAPWQRKLEG